MTAQTAGKKRDGSEGFGCTAARVKVIARMMQFISVIIGLVCAVFLIPGIVPGLGWILWGVLLGCVLGVIFGAFCRRKIGLAINIAVEWRRLCG